MAIYHFSAQFMSRSNRQSAVAAAAYRSGERFVNERTGEVHDYSPRQLNDKMEIETCIIAPAEAPAWVFQREELWNMAEFAEKRVDSQVCREINMALPHELTRDQAREAALAYAREESDRTGKIIDVSFHWQEGNHHVHMMETLRRLDGDEFSSKKAREWQTKDKLVQERETWADKMNEALEKAGHKDRISHESLADQGLAREPQIHEGKKSEIRKERNTAIKARNSVLERQAKVQARKALEDAVKEAFGDEGKEAVKIIRKIERGAKVYRFLSTMHKARKSEQQLREAFKRHGLAIPRTGAEIRKHLELVQNSHFPDLEKISSMLADKKTSLENAVIEREELIFKKGWVLRSSCDDPLLARKFAQEERIKRQVESLEKRLADARERHAKYPLEVREALKNAVKARKKFAQKLQSFGNSGLRRQLETLAVKVFGPEIKIAIVAIKLIVALLKAYRRGQEQKVKLSDNQKVDKIFGKLKSLKDGEKLAWEQHEALKTKYFSIKKLRFEDPAFLVKVINEMTERLQVLGKARNEMLNSPYGIEKLKTEIKSVEERIINLHEKIESFKRRLDVAKINRARYPEEVRTNIKAVWKINDHILRKRAFRYAKLHRTLKDKLIVLAQKAIDGGLDKQPQWKQELVQKMLRFGMLRIRGRSF